MPRGFFTQCLCLLTDGTTTIQDVKATLSAAEYDITQERPGEEAWAFGGPSLVVGYRPDVNGYAVIDIINKPWPDHMGDPKDEPQLLAAWSMGHFGPGTFPGSLERAQQHSLAWPPGKTVPNAHKGFVRVLITYVLGAGKDTPIAPSDWDGVDELNYLTQMMRKLLPMPGVLCYFNPSGEVLYDAANLEEIWSSCTESQLVPLPLWMNIRFFNLNGEVLLMDTIGGVQLDIQDIEALFTKGSHDPGEVDGYLRNVTLYLMGLDRELKAGETIDGPNETGLSWLIDVPEESASPAPRAVVRLYPKKQAAEIDRALGVIGQSLPKPKKKGWFGFGKG